ncbi:MAG TPA: peptidoglycan-binding protein [Pyrinomonadaceae bacterium]|nr:peptidoglycan-binding protein [Pyrinomonadaceae bacterium]
MILRKGMSGAEVLNLERVLQGLNFKGFEADGFFDEKTENVIRYIQRSNNLREDGIVGDQTLAILDKLFEVDKPNFTSSHIIPIESAPVLVNKDLPEIYEGLHPKLVERSLRMQELAAAEGYTIRCTQGRRTFDQQNHLYAQGRTRPGKIVTNAKGGMSFHNYGIADDWAFIVGGQISWDEKLYKNLGRWTNAVGLTWGGGWHFVDLPHCQLPDMPSCRELLAVYNANGGGEKAIQAIWRKFVR